MLATPPPGGGGAAGGGAGAGGAIACIDVWGAVDDALRLAGVAPVPVGAARLRDLGGVDQGIVARWSAGAASIMPHGGPAVVAGVRRWLLAAGLTERAVPRAVPTAADDAELLARYPEAADAIEARMLVTLARATSPLAIDLLLDQPGRWREAGQDFKPSAEDRARWTRLNRLIEPPLVVALGRPNIGKSSLLNALAGRNVALVADVPGTTRDAVGAKIDFGGLVVRYLDTAGVGHTRDADVIAREAEASALAAARSADLVLLCGDRGASWVTPPAGVASLRVALRADLGPVDERGGSPEVRVSVVRDEGLDALVEAVREWLVPSVDVENALPWRFWGE